MMQRLASFIERDVRLALSLPSTLVTPFLSIAVTVGGFAVLAKIVDPRAPITSGGRHVDYFTYVVLNLAFTAVLNAALQSVPAALRRDQVAGTLEPMIGSRAPLLSIVAGSAAWPLIFATLQLVTYLLCARAFGMQVGRVDVPLLAIVTFLGASCMGAIGIAASAAVVAFKQSPPSAVLVGGAATLLAGVLFPVTLLPPALQALSWALPLTHALAGMRAAMTGAQWSAAEADALWLAAATAVLLPAAFAALAWALRYAKTQGSLSSY